MGRFFRKVNNFRGEGQKWIVYKKGVQLAKDIHDHNDETCIYSTLLQYIKDLAKNIGILLLSQHQALPLTNRFG